jgi:DNA-directed RNA polymerase beta subunit
MINDNICWDILDTYFQKGGSSESVNPLVKHQIDSYNKFIDRTLSQIIKGFNPIKITNTLKNENGDQSHKIYVNAVQPSLTKPVYHMHDGTQTIMTPYIARMNKLTYSASLYIDVNIQIEATNDDGVIENFNKTIPGVFVGKIPVMVRSKACILQQIPGIGEENNNECRYDYGGYFIINGSEKVLVSQDRINENKTLVFKPNINSEGLYAEIRSMSDSSYLPPKTTSLNMSGKLNHMGRIIRMSTSFIKTDVPVFVMFRALGIISDKEILQHIVYDMDDIDNQKILTELMACCEDACDVHTQADAENILIKVMTGANKSANPNELLTHNIVNDFLPHVGKNFRRKALYLGYMIRKIIRIYLGYDTYDNRDSYMHKRIDTPGILMSNLFRQCYGKMTKEVKCLVERELNLWRANPGSVATCDIISNNNIHRYFRQSLLESWLKYSLSTGNWGIKSIGSFQNIRQGVSQVLNRMSYASTLSHLRRINTAMEKNGKLVQPRKLDNSQIGMICPAETPEGASVGLVKNMALSTNISIYMNSSHIRNLLIENDVKIYDDVFSNSENTKEEQEKISEYLKNMGNPNNVCVQVNGDIIGYHTEPHALYNKFKHYKRCGIIFPMTSVVWNIKVRTIVISTEAGRMYRPLMIVDYDKETKKRELRITKILRERNQTWEEYNQNKTFDAYISPCCEYNNENTEEEGFIEYLDCDEINHAMIAMNSIELEKGMKGISYPPCYTNCEIHPSLMNGILGVNIPFSDHNQSPRNCYQCIHENENVLMSNGTKKQIKDIKIGDEVIAFDLDTKETVYTKVVNHYNKKTTKLVYCIDTATGRQIIATYDHKFMTNDGWKTCMEFTNKTSLGMYISSNINHDISNFKHETILENGIDYYKEIGLLPLYTDNQKLPIIARIAGYYIYKKLSFENMNDKNTIDRDAQFLGFDYGIIDTKFILYMESIVKNISWVKHCSDMVQIEFVAGYLSAFYGQTLDHVKKSTDNINDTVKAIMDKYNISSNWYIDNKSIANFHNIINLKYNKSLLEEIVIVSEFNNHINYCNKVNIDKIKKIYSFSEWKKTVYVKGDLVFVPYNMKRSCNHFNISDIEVESSHHSFIAGNGFAVSNCAMGKQALGIYASNFNKRIDTMGNILNYPQKPLVYTKLSKYTHSNELPSGTNAVVAIMTHTGFNQEDSVIINQSALDRGLYTSTYYKSIKEQCTKNHSTGEEEIFANPTKLDTGNPGALRQFSYEKLNDEGFVPVNTPIKGSDIIIGKVMPKKTNGMVINQDNSVSLKPNDEGFVDMNYIGTNNDGYKFCNVRIRKNRKPEIGDKLASRSAQKGCIGMVYRHQDMPFTKDGVVPDIIMNPHAIPSRMTMAQLMECIMGKAGCYIGACGDSTPFTDCSVESIAKVLELSGMERYGNEIMYNGRTGEQIQTEIFIGPTYYQRLKHMVCDKIHARGSNGPIVMLTRQPSEGRARNGGLRLGEMERDCLIGHGVSEFMKEKMLDTSDNYRVFICKTCGITANSNPSKNIYKCNYCKTSTDIVQVRIPYAFKLLSQELFTMNVKLGFTSS